jgi:hypothetical protein
MRAPAALVERAAVESIRKIADAAGVDYRRLLAFSQSGRPTFDALDVDRLAACLGLRLTFDVPEWLDHVGITLLLAYPMNCAFYAFGPSVVWLGVHLARRQRVSRPPTEPPATPP